VGTCALQPVGARSLRPLLASQAKSYPLLCTASGVTREGYQRGEGLGSRTLQSLHRAAWLLERLHGLLRVPLVYLHQLSTCVSLFNAATHTVKMVLKSKVGVCSDPLCCLHRARELC